ncbi:MAG: histidine phosphatase family protein [Frankia sp.]|nr:histidine phosphatase family protein [Frankia sp.]
MRLLLLRHGRTEWNDSGRFQGQADPPLDAVGREQAARVAPLIRAMRPDLIVSSDLSRCRDTAAAIGLPFRLDPRLRETDLGTWSGRTAAEAAVLFPEEDAAWRRGEDVRRGGGETYYEVAQRAGALYDEIATGDPPIRPDGLVVFVLHGGTARALIGHMLGLPPDTWWHFGPLRNCHWTLLRQDHGRFRLTEHNVGVPRPDRAVTGPLDAAVGAHHHLPSQDAPTAPDTDPVHFSQHRR